MLTIYYPKSIINQVKMKYYEENTKFLLNDINPPCKIAIVTYILYIYIITK